MRAVRSALPEALQDRVRSARDLSRRQRREHAENPFPTALAPLDRLLDGGLPRGQLVELVGRRSGGRLSAVLAALAAATARGEAAALVDLGDGLDPRTAVEAGVEPGRLLWVRPRRVKEALAAAEILLEGGFPLVAIDLGQPPLVGGRGAEAGWLRLARQAKERQAALLVAAPYRVSGTAAATVIESRRERTVWCRGESPGESRASGALPPLLAGLHADLIRAKHRGAAPGMREALAFHGVAPWAAERVDERSHSRDSRSRDTAVPPSFPRPLPRLLPRPVDTDSMPSTVAPFDAWFPLAPPFPSVEPEALAAGG